MSIKGDVEPGNYVVVSIPETLLEKPKHWDPRLAYELGELGAYHSVAFQDFALYRDPWDVLFNGINSQQADKVILWGGYDTYHHMKGLIPRIKHPVEVRGFPVKHGRKLGLPCERWGAEKAVSTLTMPDYRLFNKEAYWEDSRLTHTLETAQWTQSLPMQFRFPRGAIKPKRAGEILQFLKQRYWYDSIYWLDDVTTEKMWSLKVLQEIEKRDLVFEFIARATWTLISGPFLVRLRDAGCRVLDLGEIPTSLFADPTLIVPFQTAIRAIRSKNLFVTYTVLLDNKTTIENSLEAVKWSRTLDVVAPCRIHKPYEGSSEEDVIAMNQNRYNPTKLKHLETLGIQKAIEKGRIDVLEEYLPKTGIIGRSADSS